MSGSNFLWEKDMDRIVSESRKAAPVAKPTGIEAMACADIAARQQVGISKYGCTVAESADDMLQHAYEESLDQSVYLRAEIERRKAERDALTRAWRIISVLHANQMDGGGEGWPEALFWLRDFEGHRAGSPPPPSTSSRKSFTPDENTF